ncbi:hypothetical protein HOY80DRAFT_879364 [Tuber brumale]|nr:hypothetical protein HOY80DRAFT_879364 [Tuber brumale]
MCRLGRERGRAKRILTNSDGGMGEKRREKERKERKKKEKKYTLRQFDVNFAPTLQQFMPHHATTFFFFFSSSFGSGHRGSLDSLHFGTVHTFSPYKFTKRRVRNLVTL